MTYRYMRMGWVVLGLCVLVAPVLEAAVRVKDVAKIQGVRENQLIGYGLVVGLSGTGDSSSMQFMLTSVVNMLERMGMSVSANDAQVKNSAAVILTATLPPFIKEGARIDVTLSSLGDCASLQGGILLMTPLKGPDGKVYAVAQGPISIGGFSAGGGGAAVQKNHLTVGRVPGGAIIENEVPTKITDGHTIAVNLNEADFTSAKRLALAINEVFPDRAFTHDPSTVIVDIPASYISNGRLIEFVSEVENITMQPDMRARIVINERTGTIVAGKNVQISTVAVSHGNLSISISRGTLPIVGGSVRAPVVETVSTESVTAEEEDARLVVLDPGVAIGEVAEALNALGVTPRDMISIFQAIKEAGGLQAELVLM